MQIQQQQKEEFKKFEGKVVVITGGSRGIGEGCIRKFASEGAKVAILDILKQEAESLANELNEKNNKNKKICQFFECDVSKEINVQKAFQEIIQTFGSINILVNNAIVFSFGKIEEVTEEQWDQALSINVKGFALCTKYAVIQMLKQNIGGSIINIASTCSFVGKPGFVPYTTTKAAILGLTRATAKDLAPHNIRVNSVAPATIQSLLVCYYYLKYCQSNYNFKAPFTEQLGTKLFGSWEKYAEIEAKDHMLGRVGQPSEVANAVCFLASEDASFITAETLMVDGGFLHQ